MFVSIDSLVEFQLDNFFSTRLQAIESQTLATKVNLVIVRKGRDQFLKFADCD